MSRRPTVRSTALLGLAVTAAALGALSPAAASPVTGHTPSRPSTATPAAIAPPAGHVLSLEVVGRGVQNYQCNAGDWAGRGPSAVLQRRHRTIGIHYRSAVDNLPQWASISDPSSVIAAEIGRAPSDTANSIPQLLLQTRQTVGGEDSMFGAVTYIQRVRTVGGVAPTEACTTALDGTTRSSAYTTIYRFFRAA